MSKIAVNEITNEAGTGGPTLPNGVAGGLTLGGDLTLDTNGIYLGGTGSANYLDDYEEGTFSPIFGGGTVSSGTVVGQYTKIGRMVHCVISLYEASISGASGPSLTNLPFNNTGYRSATSSVNHYNLFDKDLVTGIVLRNSSQIDFVTTKANAGWEGANFQNGSLLYFHINCSYYIN